MNQNQNNEPTPDIFDPDFLEASLRLAKAVRAYSKDYPGKELKGVKYWTEQVSTIRS